MTTIIAALFMIGFLVVIHEAGHFVAAKLFGVGVPVFSVGMGPRVFGVTLGGTEYRLSALPVGGYVQMAGADPFGEEDTAQWVDPDEDFMRKPVWQRLIIMAAGPGVNLALPFFVFTLVYMLGMPEAPSRIGLVLDGTPAAEAGFQVDDLVLAIDDEPVETWHEFFTTLDAHVGDEAPLRFEVQRGGQPVTLQVPAGVLRRDTEGDPDTVELGVQPFYLSSRVGVESSISPAGRAGLLTGDRILSVDGADVTTWDEMLAALGADGRHEVQVERWAEEEAGGDGTIHTLVLDMAQGAYEPEHAYTTTPWGVSPITLFASRVEGGAPAALAGVEAGDRFLAVDGQPVLTFHHFIDLVARTAQGADGARPLALTVVRDGALVSMSMTPEVTVVKGEAYSRPIIGVGSYRYMGVAIERISKRYAFAAAVPRAVDESVDVMARTATMLGNLFTGRSDARDNVGGPVAIFVVAGEVAEQGFFPYAILMGVISVSLGIVNLLPVPVLDGGQILFYAIEGIRGRPLSLELRESFQMVGVVGLVILMFLVTLNDVSRFLLGTGA